MNRALLIDLTVGLAFPPATAAAAAATWTAATGSITGGAAIGLTVAALALRLTASLREPPTRDSQHGRAETSHR